MKFTRRYVKFSIWSLGLIVLVFGARHFGIVSANNWIQYLSGFSMVWAAGEIVEKAGAYVESHKDLHRKLDHLHTKIDNHHADEIDQIHARLDKTE